MMLDCSRRLRGPGFSWEWFHCSKCSASCAHFPQDRELAFRIGVIGLSGFGIFLGRFHTI